MWWIKSRSFGHPLQQLLSNNSMLSICCSLSSTASSFPVRNLSGHLEATGLSAHRTSGASSFLSPQERDNDPEPSIWAFPAATTLCTVSSPVLEIFFLFFKNFSRNDFYNLRRDQFESLISHFKNLTIPQTCWIFVWIISSLLHCRSGLGCGSSWKWKFHSSRGSNKAQLHFNTISLSCRHTICLTGGKSLLISSSPLRSILRNRQIPAEVSSESGRAEIKFGSVLRTPGHSNFVIEPFCSALHQLPEEAQIAEFAVSNLTIISKHSQPDLICSHPAAITSWEGWFEIHGNAWRLRTWFCSFFSQALSSAISPGCQRLLGSFSWLPMSVPPILQVRESPSVARLCWGISGAHPSMIHKSRAGEKAADSSFQVHGSPRISVPSPALLRQAMLLPTQWCPKGRSPVSWQNQPGEQILVEFGAWMGELCRGEGTRCPQDTGQDIRHSFVHSLLPTAPSKPADP